MWYTKAYSRIVPLIFCISFRAWDWWPSWRDKNILLWYWWSSLRHQPSEILDLKVCYKIWWSLNLWSIEWSSKQRQGLMFLLSNTNVVWTKPWITIYATLLSIKMFKKEMGHFDLSHDKSLYALLKFQTKPPIF